MSLSISNYYKNYYENYDFTSGNTSAARTSSSSAGLAGSTSGTDSADFSEIARLFFKLDGTDDTAEDGCTDTYSPSAPGSMPAFLYGGDMKALLAQIQAGISYTDTDPAASAGNNTGSLLDTWQGLPDSSNLTYLSGNSLSALLQTLQSGSAASGYPWIEAADTTRKAAGIPAMLQAMEGFPIPFARGLDDLDSLDSTESMDTDGISGLTSLEAGLTPEDMKSILEHLQGSLDSSADSGSASAGKDNPLAAIQALLSSGDLSTVTDSGLSSLFSKVLKTLEQV
ncbi:hypothetical protein [Paenibacillus sp. S150]|uniref:hypothetical protein n=1 Tax=Paenibacillus sp. S150 TaxID=2749826 RepID=UPI001C569521|nr:hypothetical protein [Paenibacillus sp. S150]MBW4080213.1 hypothetical protein [Paenibacillus sp. S150]